MDDLKRLLIKRQHIRELIEKYEEIRTLMSSPPSASDYTHYGRRSGESRIERLHGKADDLYNRIIDESIELINLKMTVSEQIEQLSDEINKDILFSRYIRGRKWAQIAEERDVSLRWVFTKHQQALKEWDQVHGNEND